MKKERCEICGYCFKKENIKYCDICSYINMIATDNMHMFLSVKPTKVQKKNANILLNEIKLNKNVNIQLWKESARKLMNKYRNYSKKRLDDLINHTIKKRPNSEIRR